MLFGTMIRSMHAHSLMHSFSSGTGLPSVAFSVGVFLFVRTFCEKHSERLIRLRRQVGLLSSASFGVYLIHKYVLTIILRYTHIAATSWWWPIVGIPLVYSVTLVCVLILRKLPLLKHCV